MWYVMCGLALMTVAAVLMECAGRKKFKRTEKPEEEENWDGFTKM